MRTPHLILPLAVALLLVSSVFAASAVAQNTDGDRLEQALEQARIAAGKKIAPSVVMIRVERVRDDAGATPGGVRNPRENPNYARRPAGPVSGVLISRNGYILTSNFNVAGELRRITVTLSDGRELPAERLGRNEVHDLALIKINATNLPVPVVRDTRRGLAVGHFAGVVGRAMNALDHTMTWGIISALERDRQGAIQFDAQVNYGNTGGPLIDIRGRLIGIVYSIKPGVTHGLNSGVCFAMPMHLVNAELADLKAGKVVTKPRVPFFGIRPDTDAVGVVGVRVAQVIEHTGASAARLREGDVIVQVDSTRLTTVTDLRRFLRDKKVGDRIAVKFKRNGRQQSATLVLGERP